jgi:hypothetical protein
MEETLVPGKGIFTKYIHDTCTMKMDNNELIYKTIIKHLLETQLSFDKVKNSVDEYLADEHKIKNLSGYPLYLRLDLGELFNYGKDLWVKDKKSQIIDFTLTRHNIHNVSKQTELFEEFFQNCPIIQEWLDKNIKVWFDGCKVHNPHCRWYESSEHVELWFSIDIL